MNVDTIPSAGSSPGGGTINGTIHVNVHDKSDYMMTDAERNLHILGVALIQTFSLKKGLKRFGDRGKEATVKELTPQHDMEVGILPRGCVKANP